MSDFKSTVKWPSFQRNLPTIEGVSPGKAAVRKAEMEAGGMGGIRRVDWVDAQGTTYTLNTRNGMPEVVSVTAPKPPVEIKGIRGWLARVFAAPVAARFSPYTLSADTTKFTPPCTTYSVLPFTTTFNITQPDDIRWGDVISFSGAGLLVNGKTMALLKITSPPKDKALPWLIPASGVDTEKYGDDTSNTGTKRVFSVSRHTVHSWASGGLDAILQGETYRGENKAMVCGQRIDAVNNEAWMSQLYYTGYSWDSFAGEWGFTTAQVAMLLTPPYLTKINGGPAVDQGACIPSSLGIVSGTMETDRINPPTEYALVGVPGPVLLSATAASIDWVWSSKILHAFVGNEIDFRSGPTYSGTCSNSGTLSGVEFSVTATNTKSFNTHVVSLGNKGNTVQLPPSNNQILGDSLFHTGGSGDPTFHWGAADFPLGPRGLFLPQTIFAGGVVGSAGYNSEEQTGASSIVVDGNVLVDVSFSRMKTSGSEINAIPTTTELDSYIGTDITDTSTGFGAWGYVDISVVADTLAIQYGPPDHTAEISEMVAARAAQFAAQLEYDSPFIGYSHNYYTPSITTRQATDDQLLSWSTKDFILYDKPNQCFITIEADYSGEQNYGAVGHATLNVNLKISTPKGTTSSLLFTYTVTTGELLREEELLTGVKCIPSPKQRLLFTPMFQEQGDFKGAAYTTQTEVTNGATPVYLFNFMLKLDTYWAIGEDTSGYATINFIPCNLLEMLYAYVYSSKYGVDDFSRYPVDYTALFNAFQNSLFSNQWRVNYRDGVLVDWVDTLGGEYVADTTTELYRI